MILNRGLARIAQMTRIEEAILSPLSTLESVSGLCENQPLDFQTFRSEIS